MSSNDTLAPSSEDTLARLAAIIESRKTANGGDPEKSYVARLLHKGPDAFLKKIGEEATETVMAAKDVDHGGDASKLVYEVADLRLSITAARRIRISVVFMGFFCK